MDKRSDILIKRLIISVMKDRKPELYFSTLTGIIIMIFMIASITDRELFRFNFDLLGFSIGFGLNAMETIIP